MSVELISRRRIYVCIFLFLTGISLLSALIWGSESRFEVGEATTLPSLPKGYGLEDLWFKPNGQLVLILRKPDHSTVAVGSWKRGAGANEIPVHEVDLLAGVLQNGQPREVRYSHGVRGEGAGHLIVPYSVSQDGKALAAVVEGSLYVGSLSNWKEAVQMPLSSPGPAPLFSSPVEALVFSAPNLVTMVHADGSLDHCDYSKRLRGNWSTRLPAAPFIWSRGTRLLISSSRTGDFGLLEVQGFNSVRAGSGQLSAQDITAAAVSSDGARVIFGAADGIAYLYKVKYGELSAVFPEAVGIPLPVSRPVRALSLLGGGEVLIGGDFQGIYLLGSDLKVRNIFQTQGTVRMMAIHGKDLVYATPQRLIAATVENRLRPDWFILGWIATIYAIALGILSFFHDLTPR